jgi:hypothetical protein
MVKIDKKLNLVIPLEFEDETVYIHSIPIGWETFDKYFLVLSKTYSAFYSEGLTAISGPRVAAKLLRTIAQNTLRSAGVSWWEGDDGVELGLMAEIRRLSNILILLPQQGWQSRPLQVAIDQKTLTEEDVSEAMNQIVFFTVCSVVAPRQDRQRLIAGGAATSNSLTTLLTPMEYANSLRISTVTEDTGKKATRSSAVSSVG